MANSQVFQIKLGTKRFPKLLAQIADPPKALYCRGDIGLLDTLCLGIVGTRKITPYGKESAEYFAGQLAGNGFTIVSGLAYGVDTVVHQATLNAGGKTIAVFGTGIDIVHPTVNRRLAKDILDSGGLLVSEYPGKTPGQLHTFPARNRIISGLSKGVVIIEADAKSGALITARCALDQNRDVFAVPGNIFSPRSAGPNLLIQNGAKLVLTPQDVTDEYAVQEGMFGSLSPSLSTQDPVQKKIIAILGSNGPTHTDLLIKNSGVPAPQVIAAISILEIRGKIKHIGNGTYKI